MSSTEARRATVIWGGKEPREDAGPGTAPRPPTQTKPDRYGSRLSVDRWQGSPLPRVPVCLRTTSPYKRGRGVGLDRGKKRYVSRTFLPPFLLTLLRFYHHFLHFSIKARTCLYVLRLRQPPPPSKEKSSSGDKSSSERANEQKKEKDAWYFCKTVIYYCNLLYCWLINETKMICTCIILSFVLLMCHQM